MRHILDAVLELADAAQTYCILAESRQVDMECSATVRNLISRLLNDTRALPQAISCMSNQGLRNSMPAYACLPTQKDTV